LHARGLAALLAACAALLLTLGACESPPVHILQAQAYEAARDCVDPTIDIDVVDGPDPGGGCDPVCIVTPAGQNGAPTGIYVTTECGPYPPLDDTSGSEPACVAALAALARGDVCNVDGGSSCPARAGDAGCPPH
jgi:hypothetical protein